MTGPLLTADRLVKHFGGLAANDGMSLAVESSRIHALIGPNGAGKSTTIGLLSGETAADSGTVRFAGRDITRLRPFRRARLGLLRSYQVSSTFEEFTALDNIALAVQVRSGHGFRFLRPARRDPDLREPAIAQLQQLGLEHLADRRVADLAHGERRQIEIAMVLAMQPSMLLLDEPMAGMGRSERNLVVDILRGLRGKVTILLVEHDMDVVFALADTISVMVKGQRIAAGTPEEIRANPQVRAAYLGDGA
jgi:branched-chain amino acid transport system ATP-binding protein